MTAGRATDATGAPPGDIRCDATLAATLPAARVVELLGTDADDGLSDELAAERLDRHGPNTIDRGAGPGPLATFVRQFKSTMIAVLAAAAVVTIVIGDTADTVVIAAIVVLNAVIGYVQEHRAERAMAALDAMSGDVADVIRAGAHVALDVAAVVPGDLVCLAPGDVVPADLRLVVAESLQVDEAALTGESEPALKTTDAVVEGASVLDRRNVVHRGTAVLDGRGAGVAVATGVDTELGRIAMLLGEGRRPTPLQRRLAVLGRQLAAAALLVCLLVFLLGIVRGSAVDEMLLTAVTLAVAAVPEGLPAVVTVALALGARRMAARRALVRRLPAVETLGSVSVICTDKTGTLTQNRMAVERVWTPDGSFSVTGTGYAPVGAVTGPSGAAGALGRVAAVARACNDAVVQPGTDGTWDLLGDPTEGALVALARRIDAHLAPAAPVPVPPRRDEVPFDPVRKMMTTVHGADDGSSWVAVKGAVDAIAPLLTGPDIAQAARDAADELSRQGFRVLALAERRLATPAVDDREIERELHLVGVVGISDPPRRGVASSIAACRDAGVATVMITGDHPSTARAIGSRLGLLEGRPDEVMTGDEIDVLDDAVLAERIGTVRVFARTTPEQKLRIVDAWRARGAVVAMTGDGVNDAPALQRADIGVAMGQTGTDVSREAADMVLADDDFSTIVAAVAEGRRIYDNVRRFVRYLLTTNSGEVWTMLLAVALALPIPLGPTQILWINLITDGLPAVALGLEKAEPDVMDRPPRPRRESVLGGGLWPRALAFGLLMGVLVLGLQAVARDAGWRWQTMGFTALALMQLGNALAARSDRESLLRRGVTGNPWLALAVVVGVLGQLAVLYLPPLATLFDAEPLRPLELAAVGLTSVTAVVAIEVDKARRARRSRSVDAMRTSPPHPDPVR